MKMSGNDFSSRQINRINTIACFDYMNRSNDAVLMQADVSFAEIMKPRPLHESYNPSLSWIFICMNSACWHDNSSARG